MANLQLPHFGQLDASSLEEYYAVTIEFNGRSIQIDLNFEHISIEPKKLATVKHFIENIRIYDLNNKKYIDTDYTDEEADTVKTYVQYHLEELGKDELAGLIDPRSKAATHEKQLLKQLHLVRVGLYPDTNNQFATFDYSIGADITDQLVVIFTDENGNLDYMTIES